MKKCYKCQESKTSDQFSRDKYTKDGRVGECKKCVKNRDNVRYRINNPEVKNEREPSSKVGRIYGIWTVKKVLDKKTGHGSPVYLCQCNVCGANNEVTIGNLKDLGSSCRCKAYSELKIEKQKPDFSGPARYIYKSYIKGAVSRNLDFNLTFEQTKVLCQKSCYYCGQEPKTTYRKTNYVYNGIDRVNNKIGYLTNNVVPCCTSCNYAKRNYEFDDFIGWIARLRDHNLPEKLKQN